MNEYQINNLERLIKDSAPIRPNFEKAGCTIEQLVKRVGAIPDETREITLVFLYWGNALVALGDKNEFAIDGWVTATCLAAHTAGFLLPLATTMNATTQRAKRIRPAGTKAQKDAGVIRHECLAAAVNEYRKQHENAERAEWRGCLSWLKRQPVHSANKKICGYVESTATKYIKKIFKA
jgi:hypothetical protein